MKFEVSMSRRTLVLGSALVIARAALPETLVASQSGTPVPPSMTYSGNGQSAEFFTIEKEGYYLVSLDLITESGNSAVVSIESFTKEVIANAVFQGTYKGTYQNAILLPIGKYYFNVQSVDKWEVTIRSLGAVVTPENGGDFSGKYTQVESFLITSGQPYLITLDLKTWSGNSAVVSVESLSGDVVPNAVFQGNGVGTYEAIIYLLPGDYFVRISSQDTWGITISPA